MKITKLSDKTHVKADVFKLYVLNLHELYGPRPLGNLPNIFKTTTATVVEDIFGDGYPITTDFPEDPDADLPPYMVFALYNIEAAGITISHVFVTCLQDLSQLSGHPFSQFLFSI